MFVFDKESSLRQRNRAERTKRLEEQVKDIQRKQKAAESWQQWKRSLFQPLTIGIGVGVILIGGGLWASSYFSHKV
uniref:Uncharacterized protein n=1 Tax=Timema poppense TaxID=170557 RepID=A0A7R9D0P5_TIMPO|nr:unnamed protein product [Timema poppensis]